MKCLNCNAEMTNITIQTKNTQVFYSICEKCGSLWLEKGELNKMAYQVEGNIELCSEFKSEDPQEIKEDCPKCKYYKLEKVYFLGNRNFKIDHCKFCGGFWLNTGQLDLINKELKEIMPIKGEGFADFLNKVHLPLWFKRIKLQSSQTDFLKSVTPLKGAKLESETSHDCPACGELLNNYSFHGFTIQGCPNCKGIWLEKNELRELKDRLEAGSWRTLRWLDNEIDYLEKTNAMISSRYCPACKDVSLLSTTFGTSPIVIDWCPSCHGTWLDKHEFEDIIEFLKEELNKMSPDEVKSVVYKKLKEIWAGPEDPFSELLDSTAAMAALVNISVFQHPVLAKILLQFNKIARGIGL